MAKVSKGVSDKALITRTVKSAADESADAIAARVEPLIFVDEPPAPLTVAELLRRMGSGIARAQERLERADDRLAEELDDDEVARGARDEKEAQLRAILVQARSGAEAAYGGAGLVQLGLREALPQSADLLLRYADAAAERVERVAIEPLSPSFCVDKAALASSIRDAAHRFRAALEHHRREARETESARAARDAEAEQWARAYSGFADAITGLAAAAARDDIAQRVRPTARRRAGLPEETDRSPAPVSPSEPSEPSES